MTTKTTKKGITKKSNLKLGDKVAAVTKATGIKALVKWLAGEDCGCSERQEKLNKVNFRYRHAKAKCLKQIEFDWLTLFLEGHITRVTHEDQNTLVKIYNRVFTDKKEVSTCGSCVRDILDDLKKVHNLYTKENK